MTGLTPPSSAALVRLVATREASTRLRDKNFLIGSIVIVVLLLGVMAFQVVLSSGSDEARVGIVGETGVVQSKVREALRAERV